MLDVVLLQDLLTLLIEGVVECVLKGGLNERIPESIEEGSRPFFLVDLFDWLGEWIRIDAVTGYLIDVYAGDLLNQVEGSQVALTPPHEVIHPIIMCGWFECHGVHVPKVVGRLRVTILNLTATVIVVLLSLIVKSAIEAWYLLSYLQHFQWVADECSHQGSHSWSINNCYSVAHLYK